MVRGEISVGTNKHIFLTGFMGAGKTTVGKELSKQLSIPVVDTDDHIEGKMGKQISEIFLEEGEAHFRNLETEALKELSRQQEQIITTGGGIILRQANRQIMKETGVIIFLYCNIEETTKRLINDNSRPLLKEDIDSNKNLFKERLPFYQQADFEIDTTNKSIALIVDEIRAMLE